MSISGERIQANGIGLNVYSEGDGPPVLLLHGFPDSNALWRHVTPALVESGYRIISPDLRGFGLSDAPAGRKNYHCKHAVADMAGLLDVLGIENAHVVGHDWGAVIGWLLAGNNPARVRSYTALSVGHPRAYANAGLEQKRKGWYTFFFQLPGIAEWTLSGSDWSRFRRWVHNYPEAENWIADLSRPGRLTAALNWYRANLFHVLFASHPPCPVPAMGVWSSRDMALAEDQMINSEKYVESSWRYERIDKCGHWIPLEVPEILSVLLLDFLSNPGD